jgi:hypothetical protein
VNLYKSELVPQKSEQIEQFGKESIEFEQKYRKAGDNPIK